jgi:hypothetical protein
MPLAYTAPQAKLTKDIQATKTQLGLLQDSMRRVEQQQQQLEAERKGLADKEKQLGNSITPEQQEELQLERAVILQRLASQDARLASQEAQCLILQERLTSLQVGPKLKSGFGVKCCWLCSLQLLHAAKVVGCVMRWCHAQAGRYFMQTCP